MAEFSFNLVDAPWIPCVDLDGNRQRLGIHELLLRAHQLRAIEHQNPLTEAALLRVLLAVIHRAVDGPRDSHEWKHLYQAGRFGDIILDYVEKWRHRFDLFSQEAPFYQTPGLCVLDGDNNPLPQSIALIFLATARGNIKTIFDHSTDETPIDAKPADVACGLVTAQMFSFGGLNRKTTNYFGNHFRVEDTPLVKGISVFIAGTNLFETLVLNLLVCNDNEPIPKIGVDSPVWERGTRAGAITNKKNAIPPSGYLNYLTPQPRHFLLCPSRDGENTIVRHLHIAQGEMFLDVDDPFFVSKRDINGNKTPIKPDINRLVWRDSLALFSFNQEKDDRPRVFSHVHAMKRVVELPKRYNCLAYAFVNERGPKVNPLAWRKEKLNVPLSLLSDRNVVAHLEKGMAFSEKGAAILDRAVKTFMREYLPENSKDVSEKAAASGAVRTYWDRLEGHFHRFLLDLDDPEGALESWEESLKRTARNALDICVSGRYRGSARSYKAWAAASAYLNASLSKLHE